MNEKSPAPKSRANLSPHSVHLFDVFASPFGHRHTGFAERAVCRIVGLYVEVQERMHFFSGHAKVRFSAASV